MFSCIDDITLDLPAYEPKIVVEGFIEQGDVARVYLTHSQGYFDSIGTDSVDVEIEIGGFPITLTLPEFLYKTIVLDAIVTVSDGVKTDTLKMWFDQSSFPYLFYVGNAIIGEEGGTYSLKIEADNKVLTSSTTIPTVVPIDSLWFEFMAENEDSLGFIYGIFDDPIDEVNFYRLFTKTEGRDSSWVHQRNSVFPDNTINGDEDNMFVMYHGNNRMENNNEEGSFYFKLGDKVQVKLCTIDYNHYMFWRTFQMSAGGGGNPFAAPVPTETNIEGGLGVWGGYGVSITEYTVEYIEP